VKGRPPGWHQTPAPRFAGRALGEMLQTRLSLLLQPQGPPRARFQSHPRRRRSHPIPFAHSPAGGDRPGSRPTDRTASPWKSWTWKRWKRPRGPFPSHHRRPDRRGPPEPCGEHSADAGDAGGREGGSLRRRRPAAG